MTLGYKVFFSKRAGVGRDLPAGNDHLKWVPTTSTLIYGERDAILVDTQLTKAAGRDLVDWVVDSGKNLTTIYITHAHGDHFYGNAALIERFPEAKILATPEVVAKMAEAILPDGMDAFWRRLFPGEIPEKLATAVTLNEDHFMLEGEKLEVVRIGRTDTDETTALWVPSIELVVTGDAVYDNTHPYLGESFTKQSRLEWIAALDKIAALHPKIVVGGHSDPSKDFSPNAVHETKAYFENLERLNQQTSSAEELYSRMLELYPNRLNVGSLWGAASLLKK
jgi:glyoxylase-like metal-dependent hydrolase (beta-lactamase superfamily II)